MAASLDCGWQLAAAASRQARVQAAEAASPSEPDERSPFAGWDGRPPRPSSEQRAWRTSSFAANAGLLSRRPDHTGATPAIPAAAVRAAACVW